MPTLYYAPNACSLAAHIVLEWIGAPYQAIKVDYGSPELLAVNPAGAVPTLQEDDGWLLTQAGAILDYLSLKHPEAGLSGGNDLRGKTEVHRWSAFLTSDMHAAFWPIFMPDRFTVDEGEAAKEAIVTAGKITAAKQFAKLDQHLQDRDWIVEGRSIIDAYAFPMIRWGAKLLDGGLTAYPNIRRLHDRLKADPAVQRVLAQEAAA